MLDTGYSKESLAPVVAKLLWRSRLTLFFYPASRNQHQASVSHLQLSLLQKLGTDVKISADIDFYFYEAAFV